MGYFEPDEWMEGPNNKETILKAITRLKQDIIRIESCKSIDAYVRGPKDIIHERLDGLVEHIENVFEEGFVIADFLTDVDKRDMEMEVI